MTKKDKYLVALDVGSTKTCAILSEVDDSGAARFISMGAAESKEALIGNAHGVPFIAVRGRIGGSAMAAAAVNGLARAGL